MPRKAELIDFRGHRILWCNYSRLAPEEMILLLKDASRLGRTLGKQVFILADFNKTPKSKAFNDLLKSYGKQYHRDGIDVKVAVLGINSGLKRVIVNATMIVTNIRNVKLFEAKDTAMDWLVGVEVENPI